MPRPLRIQAAGSYHLTGRGTGPCTIFRDAADWTSFLAILGAVVSRCRWHCQAFCLLHTHYHLLVTTEEENLAAGMQRLMGCYAQSFNRRHGRSGHLFQGRYHSSSIATDAHLLETIRYIALNPVRAGLCVRPEHWVWSSYAAAIGVSPAPKLFSRRRLLELFASDEARAAGHLKSFVEDEEPTLAPDALLYGV